MSIAGDIASEIYSKHANFIRKKWVDDLKIAYENKDWTAVEVLLKKMNEFEFCE